ncbi:DUF6538 domain-containing protein [Acetobacter okinawensis]|uniref:Recombinase domain-containing protein n=1 Tax=Acetobacter okinawensis TaxID=1076594 RepID=A0A252BUL8_9PROT|nr:DUF6538 domain-containing protein [Acetobacter okinawensis]OUJ12634.1 hypothetical protein HK26_01185 [Acetobacter okinawensis]
MNDMYNIFRRAGSQTWSVRFHVPRDRRSDVGKAFGTKTGHKAEVVKTLGTSDRKEAMGRRYKALEDIRKEIDVRLQEIGLPPLHGDWQPDWAFPWAEDEQTIAEALEARKELAKASTREDQTEEVYTEDRNGLPHRTTIRTSERAVIAPLHSEELSLRAIAGRLEGMGIKTSRGKAEWTTAAVKRCLG